MELQVLKQQIPVVEFNKEELKKSLGEHLEKYSNLVVTPETEKDCKKAKAELTKLATNIETFRKETKKTLSEPIAQFESECKELVSLIHEVVKPIDSQLKEIEEARKAEKEELITVEIEKIVSEFELDDKHAPMLNISASYLNKTMSMNKITTDLKNRAEVLKMAQMSVVRNIEIVKSTCEMYNERLVSSKLDVESWVMLLERDSDVNAVVTAIHNEGKKRLNQEMEEVEREAQEIMNEPMPELVVHEEPIEASVCKEALEGPILTATLRFHGTAAQFKVIKDVMAKIGVKYEKVNL